MMSFHTSNAAEVIIILLHPFQNSEKINLLLPMQCGGAHFVLESYVGHHTC